MVEMIDYVKKHTKTFFLKIILILMFIPIVVICCFAAPQLIIEGLVSSEVEFWFVLPFSVLMSLVLLPVVYAIFQTWNLFSNIEKSDYYSDDSAKRLKTIMHCAYITTGLFVGMMPSMFYFAENDDAPGLALLGLVFVGASIAVVVFASLMRDLIIEKGEEL